MFKINLLPLKLNRPHAALAFILVAVSLFVPVIGILTILGVITLLLGYLKKFTIVEAIGLAILLLFSFVIVFYSLITFFHLHFPLEYIAPLFLLGGFGFLFATYRKALLKPHWATRRKSDVVAVVITLITFGLLLVPVLGQSPSYIAQFLSYGEDNASHYALSRYINQHDSFTYNQSGDEAGLVPSLEIYPQGFHVNAALFTSLLKPFLVSEERFIRSYVVFISAMYALFIFWFIKLCTLTIEKLSWIVTVSAIPALALLASLSFFILTLDRGFQPQIFSFAFLCGVTFLFMVLHADKKLVWPTVLIALYLSIGIAASWWFLLVIVFLLGLFYLLRNGYIQPLLSSWRTYLLPTILAIFGILYPILVNVFLSKKHDPLTEPGGVDSLPLDFLIYVAIASLALPLIVKLKDKAISYLYVGLGASLLLATIIGVYHLVRVGHFEYYFLKMIYAILLFLIVITSIGILHLANKLFSRLSRIMRWVVPGILIAGFVIIATISNFVFIKVYVNNWFPNSVEIADTPILFTEKTSSYDDILFVGDCNSASDYLSNRWAGARLLSESQERGKLIIDILNMRWEKTNQRLDTYLSHGKHILLSIDRRCVDQLPILSDLQKYNNVTVVYTH